MRTTPPNEGSSWLNGRWTRGTTTERSHTAHQVNSQLRNTGTTTGQWLEIYRQGDDDEHLTIITGGPVRQDRVPLRLVMNEDMEDQALLTFSATRSTYHAYSWRRHLKLSAQTALSTR